MSKFDYDLFVIGAGSGGVRAARMSAGFGAKVAVAEERFMGGTCVNVGCVPKKLFVYGAHFADDFEDARGFGWNSRRPDFDWPTLRANKDREIERLNGIYRNMLESAGVAIYDSRARFIDAHTVDVGGQRISARYILIATGSRPFTPDFPGNDLFFSSNEIFALDELPRRALISGGGYIACEFASVFHGLGVETTLIHRGNLVLRGFDEDIRRHVSDEMQKRGIKILYERDFDRIEKDAENGRTVYRTCLEGGDVHESELILCAIGRLPNTGDLGLKEAGVATGARHAVIVDEHYQTSVPSVYAVGDVIDRYQLTPVALAEGTAVAKTLFANQPTTVDYENIPTAVFCSPNIGTVGLTEKDARERYGDVTVFRSVFRPMKHTLSGREERTLMKLVVDSRSDRVVGVHMAGPEAGEIVQGLAVALKAGATKAVFDQTIGIHPTAAEEFVTMRSPVQ